MLVSTARNITYNNLGNRDVNPNLAQLATLLLPPAPPPAIIAMALPMSSLPPLPALLLFTIPHNKHHT